MTRYTEEEFQTFQIARKGSNKDVAGSEVSDEGKESSLQSKCNGWLDKHGYPFIHDRSRGKNKRGQILDLHIYLPEGRHVVMELKADGRGMSDEQNDTFRKIKFLGHEIYVVRSFKRFLEIVEGSK